MKNIAIIIFFSIVIFLIIKKYNKFKKSNEIIQQKIFDTKNKFILQNVYCTFKKYIFFEKKAYNVYFIDNSIIIIYKYGLTKKTYIISNNENEVFPFSLFQNKIEGYNITSKDGNIIINGKMSNQLILNNEFKDVDHLTLIISTNLEENEVNIQLQKFNLL